ncbi:MAG: ferrichrome ABC transporter permease [Acidobacteriota bacterium]
MLAQALTIFLGAFLLFEVEPVVAKHILPWFGGAPAVWTTCLLFFQFVLLAGYLYAHAVIRLLSPSAQRALHLCLLGLSLVLLGACAASWGSPILADAAWKPAGTASPVPRILALLTVSVGLPYFLLSTTGPLVQAWTARARGGSSVYRLYALSNAGSLLAPLTYPFLVEPVLTLRAQAAIWACLYAVFAAGSGFCAWRAAARTLPGTFASPEPEEAHGREGDRLPYAFWFALSACGSLMLLAATNQMCQEVAAIPFLWLLPLCLYLLSFILCFESDRLYSRAVFGILLAASLGWAALLLFRGYLVPVRAQVAGYSLALFAACMVCHGELARAKPRPSRLTSFYLTVAAGGAAGAVFVALAAPSLFRGFWEFHLGLWLSGLLAIVALARDADSWVRRGPAWPALPVLLASAALAWHVRGTRLPAVVERLRGAPGATALAAGGLLLALLWLLRRRPRPLAPRGRPYFSAACLAGALGFLAYVLLSDLRAFRESAVGMSRNFYGVLTVEEKHEMDPNLRRLDLRHGRIVHGFQYQAPEKRRVPTTYYSETSGIGLLLRNHPRRAAGPMRVGVVGLGVGTIAAYGRAGDEYRFYDINPAVAALSALPGSVFTYLRDSPARTVLVMGDARLSLERELARGTPQNFDVLAIDAFSSDSIPVHLLTREALAIDLAHLRRPDGVLAIHISNRNLNLAPVVRTLADAFRLEAGVVDTSSEDDASWGATWVLLSRDARVLETPAIEEASGELEGKKGVALWTDDYSNLFRVLK